MTGRRAYTLVEIIIAMAVMVFLVGALVMMLRSGRRESDFMVGKLAARQEARLAFRRMCNEIRESPRLILPDDMVHYDTENYLYKHICDSPALEEKWGPASNSLFLETYYGEIVSYYYYHEDEGRDTDGNGRRDVNQLRRLNMTGRAGDPGTRPEIMARGVMAAPAEPSIFTVARYFPGKQPADVFIKLSVRENGGKGEAGSLFNLVSSVFLRNVESGGDSW